MELDSGADSVSSTPRSIHHLNPHNQSERSVVRLMCSFGGKILPRPHDNQLRYVGGDTRIVAINRTSTSFSNLVTKLSKLLPPDYHSNYNFTIKYQLPNEELEALITVSTDEDVENMLEEFDRLAVQQQAQGVANAKVVRLRLFLFTNSEEEESRTSSIVSLLDGSRKRENWFFDALNGGLERGKSEVSSIVSEVPDYLFGLDGSDESVGVKVKNAANRFAVPGSDPGSPAAPVYGSASSAQALPNLPPVKTKPEKLVEEVVVEPAAVPYTVGFTGSGPVYPAPSSPYPGHTHHPMQAIPVYYGPAGLGHGPVSRPHHMQAVSVPVPGHGHYMQPYGVVQGQGQVQVPVACSGSGPGTMYEMQMQANMVPGQGGGGSGPGHAVYYGVKNTGGMVGRYPGMGVPVTGDETVGSGPDGNKARSLPA